MNESESNAKIKILIIFSNLLKMFDEIQSEAIKTHI